MSEKVGRGPETPAPWRAAVRPPSASIIGEARGLVETNGLRRKQLRCCRCGEPVEGKDALLFNGFCAYCDKLYALYAHEDG